MSTPALNDQAGELQPYPGLRPFRADETHLYFGREKHRADLLRRMVATRFVAVVGTSGSGKSSLLHAGLVPDLLCGYLPKTGSDWVIVEATPGADPLGRLAGALTDVGWNTDAAALRIDSSHVLDLASRHLGTGQQLLVLVDQLEELFRLKFSADDEVDADEKAAFVRLLLTTGGQRQDVPAQRADVHVIIAMRSEFLGRASVYRGLPEAIDQGQYLIPRLSREQLRQAIECPARVAGGDVDDALVQRLLIELGDDQDQLPVLQHALMRCWQLRENERVGFRAYDASGGLARALSHHANETLNDAMRATGPRAEVILKRAFQALRETDVHGGQTRRPTTCVDLCDLAQCTPAELASALLPFRERSFVLPPPGVALDPTTLVDVSHEALLRGWDTLGRWIEDDDRDVRLYQRIARRAADELGAEKPDYFVPPLLPVLVKFWNDRQPSATWAERHHRGYGAARAFLEASQQHQQQRESEEARRAHELAEALRKRARTRIRSRIGAAFAVAVLALLLGFVTSAGRESERLERERNRLQGLLVSAKVAAVPATNTDLRLQLASEAVRRLAASASQQSPLPELLDSQKALLEALLAAPLPVDVQWAAPASATPEISTVAVSANGQDIFFVNARTLHRIDVAGRQTRFRVPLGDEIGDEPFLMPVGEKLLLFGFPRAYFVDGATGARLGGVIDEIHAAAVSADGSTAAFLHGGELLLCDVASNCAAPERHDVKAQAASNLALAADGSYVVTFGAKLTLFATRPWQQRAEKTLDDVEMLAIGTTQGPSGANQSQVQLCTSTELRAYDAYDLSLDMRVQARFTPEATACVLAESRVLTSHGDNAVRTWSAEGRALSLASARVPSLKHMGVGLDLVAVAGDQLRVWDITPFGRRAYAADVRFVRRNEYALGAQLQALDSGVVEPAPELLFEGQRPVAVSDSLRLAVYAKLGAPARPPYTTRVREVVLADVHPGMPPTVRWKFSPPADGQGVDTRSSARPAIAISNDDRFVAVQIDGEFFIVSTQDREDVRTLPGWTEAAFTPTSEMLALGSKGIAAVSLSDAKPRPLPGWETAASTNASTNALLSRQTPPRALPIHAFSADGTWLAIADNRGQGGVVTVHRWPDLAIAAQLPHETSVTHVAFRRDGRALVASTADATAHVWEIAPGREILRLATRGADAGDAIAVFTPIGQLAVLDRSGVSVLPTNPDAWQAEACRRIARGLDEQEWRRVVGSEVPFNQTCPATP